MASEFLCFNVLEFLCLNGSIKIHYTVQRGAVNAEALGNIANIIVSIRHQCFSHG
jgi:hypothetical protein